MAEPSPEQEQQLITQQANTLLIKLNKSYILLQKLNQDIESRPFSTRIHGQFDHELKKSQSTIAKLSSLLRKYHSFEFSSNLSLEMKENDDPTSSKPIDASFILQFKDICLKIEREWRIGTKQISNYQSKYGNNTDSDHYYSDNDTRYNHRKRYKNRKNTSSSRSGTRSTSSSPIHSFSNPNSPLYQHSKMSKSMTITKNNTKNEIPLLNIGLSRSQILQKQKYMQKSSDSAYHAKIGNDFVPYSEEERLNQQIRDINDDLQYLLDINKQVNSLVTEQQNDVDDIEKKVDRAHDNVEQGANTLTSIRKSPLTYAIIGGLGMAALGAPIILVGVGVKAAVGGAVGLGTVGAFSGSIYAKKSNEMMDDINKKDLEQKLLNEELQKKKNRDNNDENDNGKNIGFQTKPRKRLYHHGGKKKKYNYKDMHDDDDEDIDDWDARN